MVGWISTFWEACNVINTLQQCKRIIHTTHKNMNASHKDEIAQKTTYIKNTYTLNDSIYIIQKQAKLIYDVGSQASDYP